MKRLGKALSLRPKERSLHHKSMCYPASTETVMGTTTCGNVTYVRYVTT